MKELNPQLTELREQGNRAALVFIHGFSGDIEKTWGSFASYLLEDKRISDWDMYSIGYPTTLLLDHLWGWSAHPDISTLALGLTTQCSIDPLNRYDNLIFIAHSMGGLVIQRALIDSEKLAKKTSSLLMFGTPSQGLAKASFFSWYKRQIKDMSKDGEFIKTLRTDWENRPRTFSTKVIAGNKDDFVRTISSLGPFEESEKEVVPGNHLDIVRPKSKADPSIQIVIKAMLGDTSSSININRSSLLAIEQNQFENVVTEWLPYVGALDEFGLVELALALEELDRKDEALILLEKNKSAGTDVQGVLAGRIKRLWLYVPTNKRWNRARTLYENAYNVSIENKDYDQAYYHAINVAFLDFCGNKNNLGDSMAKIALGCVEETKTTFWSLATIAEGLLILGYDDRALESYERALCYKPQPSLRDIGSMYKQAMYILKFSKKPEIAEKLDQLLVKTATDKTYEITQENHKD